MKRPLLLFISLLIPISILAWQTWTLHHQRESGETVTFPIKGFDPRDMLSGHYLTYQVDYGLDNSSGCPTSDIAAYACLRPEKRIFPLDELPDSCSQFIRGSCNNESQFVSGLEHFYIPQQYADQLDAKVRGNQGKILVSIDKQGNTGVKDLLIDDRPWREIVED